MKREDVEKLLGWAKEGQKVFDESGETDFEELRRREQREIYDRFAESGFDVHDGSIDKYTGYKKVEIGDLTARFYFHDESNYPFDMLLFIGEDCVPVQEFVQHLESLLFGQTTIVNLTPHEITVYDAAGESVLQVIPSSGMARAAQTREPLDRINGIPVSKTGYGAVEGLPDQRDGVIYIVSVLTAQAAPNRKDLYIVDELVRDDTGRILGCKALAQI